MEISEFKDGYVLSYKGNDYTYMGKSKEIIKQISLKAKELLLANLK